MTKPDIRTTRPKAKDREIQDKDLQLGIRDVQNQVEVLAERKSDGSTSASRPLSMPIRIVSRAVEWVTAALVGRGHVLTPAQLVDMEKIAERHYQATDIRPSFLLNSNRGRLPCGWV